MNNTITLLMSVKNKSEVESVDYKIADYLLGHLGQMERMTTAFLAQECHVSKSAISRFCRNIGLHDFLDLQLMARMPLTKPKVQTYLESELPVNQQFIHNLQCHFNVFDNMDESFNEMAEVFHQANHRIVMGHMQSSLPALQMQYDFAQLGIQISWSGDIVSQKEILLHSEATDLIIVFSTSGNFFKNVFSRPAQLNDCKAQIIMISLTKAIRVPQYIKQWISLDGDAQDYSASLLLMIFAQLFHLNYYQKYYVSSNETMNMFMK